MNIAKTPTGTIATAVAPLFILKKEFFGILEIDKRVTYIYIKKITHLNGYTTF